MRSRAGARHAVQVGVEQQVGHHRQVQVERALLEHHAQPGQRAAGVAAHVVAQHLDAALVGREQAGEQLQQGGLARAVGAEQREHFAGLQAHTHALERGFAGVGLVQAMGLEQRRVHPLTPVGLASRFMRCSRRFSRSTVSRTACR